LLNNVAYATDLRYFDHGVIRFLKVFKSSIYVIHISAPGLVDMHEPFAQDLLKAGINPKVNYQKLFLRNIRGKHIAAEIDLVLDPLEIKVFSFSSNKHQTLERLLGEPGDKIHHFHDLPYLVFPYLNWHNDPSFYW
jgi:hypothetical protein